MDAELSTVPQEPDDDSPDFDGGEIEKMFRVLEITDNSVVLVHLPLDADQELYNAVIEATKRWRAERPKLTFIFLPSTVSIDVLDEAKMAELGWRKGNAKNPNQLTKGPRRKWHFENGKLVKKTT